MTIPGFARDAHYHPSATRTLKTLIVSPSTSAQFETEETADPFNFGEHRGLIFAHLNVHSLLPKLDELRSSLVEPTSLPVVAFSESWLDDTVSDGEISIPGYSAFRKDRNRNGGGVVVYVNETLRASKRPDLDNSELEAVWVEIRQTASKRLVVGVLYRPPSSDSGFMTDLSEVLQMLRLEQKEIIILGDLNCNMLKADGPTKQLLEILEENDLHQLITAPTRVTRESETIIDLLITSDRDKYAEVGCRDCSLSDHRLVYGSRKLEFVTPKAKHRVHVSQYRVYSKCCTEALKRDLDGVPWHILEIFDDIEDSWNMWKLLFTSVLNEHAPIKKSRKRRHQVPWITDEIRDLFRIRDHLGKKARKSKDEGVWIEYRSVRNYVTAELRRSKRTYLEGIAWRAKKQPKKLWNEMNKLLGRNAVTQIQLIRAEEGDLVDNSDIANAFNTFFINRIERMAADDVQMGLTPASCNQSMAELPKFEFTPVDESTVLDLLGNLDARKTSGCDNLQARALKLAAEAIARPLCNLFNLSLSSSQLPLEWKSANVTPVPKSGDATDIENYRPISVLSAVAKTMERIVFNQLYSYLQKHSLLSQHQSGFRPSHSTQDVLIKTMDDWRKSIDEDRVVGALFLDLSKAFDVINHELLLNKMQLEFGVVGKADEWFRNYLSGRRQRVCVGQETSPWMTPKFGVPQGSILGPLLFILFVNALPKSVNQCSLNMYADDTTLYTAAETADQAIETLRADAELTLAWFNQNRLIVNVKKTHFMAIGRRRRRMEISEAKLALQNVELYPEQTVTYLGVCLDDQLIWKKHVNKVRSKCFMGLAKLNRVCRDLPMATRKKLYCALIQPHTDYCSVVWDQMSENLNNKVEAIQNAGIRFILGAPRKRMTLRLKVKPKQQCRMLLTCTTMLPIQSLWKSGLTC